MSDTFDPKRAAVTRELEYTSPLLACRFGGGSSVFAAAQDAAIVRWSLESGERAVLEGHESWVRTLAVSPDGATLVTGGYDERLIWWPAEAPSPSPQRTVRAHEGWVRGVDFSPDGALVASGGNDGLVKLWRAEDGEPVRTLGDHGTQVWSVAFSPDGATLASGDLRGGVRLWDVHAAELRAELDASELYRYDKGFRADIGGVRDLRFDAAGERLIAAGITDVTNAFAGVGNPLVIVFSLTGEPARELHRSKGPLRGVAWGAVPLGAGRVAAAAGGGGARHLLFFESGQVEEVHALQLPNTARGLDVSRDGARLATAHFDRKLRLTSFEAPAAAPEG